MTESKDAQQLREERSFRTPEEAEAWVSFVVAMTPRIHLGVASTESAEALAFAIHFAADRHLEGYRARMELLAAEQERVYRLHESRSGSGAHIPRGGTIL